MKIKKLLVLLFSSLCLSVVASVQEVTVIDTVEREERFYNPVFSSIKRLGYDITYHSLDHVLDLPLDQLGLLRCKAAFFIFGPEFLSAVNKSHVCAKVLQALHKVALRQGILVGLVFPSLRAAEGVNMLRMLAPIFSQLALDVPGGVLPYPFALSGLTPADFAAEQAIDLNTFFYVANVFLSTPLESRPRDFDTTLNGPLGGIELDADQMQAVLVEKGTSISLLPRFAQCSSIVKKTLPYGLYWFNHRRNNHLFITTSTIFSFGGVSENYHVTPIDVGLRLEMLQQVHRMMFEVLSLAKATDAAEAKKIANSLLQAPAPVPSPAATDILFAKEELSQQDKRKIAWMDLDVFAPVEGESSPEKDLLLEQDRRLLVKNMIAAGLDSLWITANPHEYMSPIGRYATPEKKQRYFAMLRNFTAYLAQGYKEAGVVLPKIYIGFEITNNLRAPHLPTRYAMDLYENAYEDLPVPIDLSFWQQEVMTPFAELVKLWQDNTLSSGVPLAGVVLDLEMYLRKKSPSFTSMMTFDGMSFQRFVRQQRLSWGSSVAMRDRPLLLMRHSKMSHYYTFLERSAEKIGAQIKTSLEQSLPNCTIMCYKPHIKISWFYRGLIKGLTGVAIAKHSKSQPGGIKPVQLLTFNSEFLAHKDWFDNQDLPVTHSCVLMLSKIRWQEDFDWVSQLLMRHGSLWLNKFSRTVGRLPINQADRWTDIERLCAPIEVCRGFFEVLRGQ
jgi:hypothetical protein